MANERLTFPQDAHQGLFCKAGTTPVEWRVQDGLTDYADAVRFMEERVEKIARGEAPELIWLVEHPPLYTAGTSAKTTDLRSPIFSVYQTGRGGEHTYHGPGQRVAYVMLDLNQRGQDIRKFVTALETWIIGALDRFNVRGEVRDGRVGVWVRRPEKAQGAEDKIAAIGIRVRKWVTFHGISLNIEPDLAHFSGIVPCGIADPRYDVTSLVDLGLPVTMADADVALRAAFQDVFGPIAD